MVCVERSPVLAATTRREVGVAHRQDDGGVAETFLHLTKRCPRHDKLRGKRVAAVVPPNATQSCATASAPESKRPIG